MSSRVSINVPGLEHGTNPIPAASRIGPFIATGGIRGVDPATSEMSADAHVQVMQMFANLQAVLAQAGATAADVLKITIWIKDSSIRSLINAEWLKLFPDPASRPARHVLNYDLGHGMLVQCDALAVITPRADQKAPK